MYEKITLVNSAPNVPSSDPPQCLISLDPISSGLSFIRSSQLPPSLSPRLTQSGAALLRCPATDGEALQDPHLPERPLHYIRGELRLEKVVNDTSLVVMRREVRHST